MEDENNIDEDDSFVEIGNQKFPKDTVINWDDIVKEKVITSGRFGLIYNGYLHLNDSWR